MCRSCVSPVTWRACGRGKRCNLRNMREHHFFVALNSGIAALLTLTLAGSAAAQTAPRNQVAGTVISVDTPAKQVIVKTDQGQSLTATATDRTLVLRIPPGETDA